MLRWSIRSASQHWPQSIPSRTVADTTQALHQRQVTRSLSTSRPSLKSGKSASSSRFNARHASDPYVLARSDPHVAKSLRLPIPTLSSEFVSRSAYKLWELEEKHHFICPKRKSDRGRIIVELGAAPGGWTQMALEIMAKQGKEEVATRPRSPIFALDLLPLSPVVQAMADIEFLQGDFNDPAIRTELTQRIQQWSEGAAARDSDEASGKVDVILSDMLSNTHPNPTVTIANSMRLLESLLSFVLDRLRISPTSFLVVKILQSQETDDFKKEYLEGSQGVFESVKMTKVKSSRKESRETYWVCKGFRGMPK